MIKFLKKHNGYKVGDTATLEKGIEAYLVKVKVAESVDNTVKEEKPKDKPKTAKKPSKPRSSKPKTVKKEA